MLAWDKHTSFLIAKRRERERREEKTSGLEREIEREKARMRK
jgi:hypothetical protein